MDYPVEYLSLSFSIFLAPTLARIAAVSSLLLILYSTGFTRYLDYDSWSSTKGFVLGSEMLPWDASFLSRGKYY